jgi:hypothetical protein
MSLHALRLSLQIFPHWHEMLRQGKLQIQPRTAVREDKRNFVEGMRIIFFGSNAFIFIVYLSL